MQQPDNNSTIKFIYIAAAFFVLAALGFGLSNRACSPSSPVLCWTPAAYTGDAAAGQIAPVYYHHRARAWHLVCDRNCRAPAVCYYFCCGGDARGDQSEMADSTCTCQMGGESAWFGDMGPDSCAIGQGGNFRSMLEQAGAGDTKTQVQVARFYESGRNDDPKPDMTEALFWYRSAAEKGNLDAQLKLGELYAKSSVAGECQQAIDWYKKAASKNIIIDGAEKTDALAELDIMQARGRLGEIFEKGTCGTIDYAEAAHWYKEAVPTAASQWDTNDEEPVATHLGDIYMKGGHGVDKNAADAMRWYRTAASANSTSKTARAEYELSMIYAKGDLVEQDFVTACHWYAIAGRDPRYRSRNICDPIEPYLMPGDLQKLTPIIYRGGEPK